MSVAIVTGSAGLIGAESVRSLCAQGMQVVGIDNDMRQELFGAEASTKWSRDQLIAHQTSYHHESVDIRDETAINGIFQKYGNNIELVIHCAAQPSHDWAAQDPMKDFTINANGTQVLLEATRKFCPEAVFIYLSTNKVYGDTPNRLPLIEEATRWSVDSNHPYARLGIDEEMSIDHSLHSLFGVSKAAADLMVQEYGRYFQMKTYCFRGGCLTGPGHSGTELHGFLAYLMKCVINEKPYRIFGYKGKQVRDNIHSHDLVSAFWEVYKKPIIGGRVYNIGGGVHSNCSMLEAITIAENIAGKKLDYSYVDENRKGDHMWWISDVSRFKADYPHWKYRYDIKKIMQEIHEGQIERTAIIPRNRAVA